MFLLATVIYAASGPMAANLRAHTKEPLLFVSLLMGVLVGLSTWLLGKYYAALGMAIDYLTMYLLITPMIAAVSQRCRVA